MSSTPWRVGRKVGRTIYDAENNLIGCMDSIRDAAYVVTATDTASKMIPLVLAVSQAMTFLKRSAAVNPLDIADRHAEAQTVAMKLDAALKEIK